MERPCDSCGTVYVAKRATSKYCSTRCRTRASRGGEVIEFATKSSEPTEAGPTELAARRELEAAGRLETTLGQACLALARRLDMPGVDTGSAMASVAGRLDDLLAKATKGTGAT